MSNGEKKSFSNLTEEEREKLGFIFEKKDDIDNYNKYSMPADGIVPVGDYRITFTYEDWYGYGYITVLKAELAEWQEIDLIVNNPDGLKWSGSETQSKVIIGFSGFNFEKAGVERVVIHMELLDSELKNEIEAEYQNGSVTFVLPENSSTDEEKFSIYAEIISANYVNITTNSTIITINKSLNLI